MPKYRFICDKCSLESTQYASVKTEQIACNNCDGTMKRQLPSAGSQVSREVVDSYSNVRQEEDQRKLTKDRKTEYFWEHEVPRLVQHYSIETCLEEGWLVYNDKGELVINKPPSKR